jgi:hypothetical protein
LKERRQETGPVRGDDEPPAGAALSLDAPPRPCFELLRTVQEQTVARGEICEEIPLLIQGQPPVALVQGEAARAEAPLLQPNRQIFQECRLTAAVRADESGAEAEAGETGEQLLPGDPRKAIPDRQNPVDGEGVVTSPDW